MNDGRIPGTPRPPAVWIAVAWLIAIVALSTLASVRPQLVLQWTQHIPGRDKTGHFLLMGGFAAVSVLAFADRRLAARRVSALAVMAWVALLVAIEEAVQLWLPRRTFSVADLAWSLSGVVSFGALAAIWRALGKRDPTAEH